MFSPLATEFIIEPNVSKRKAEEEHHSIDSKFN